MCCGLKSCFSRLASWFRPYNEYDNEDSKLIKAIDKLKINIASYNKELSKATELHATLKGMINLKEGDYTKEQREAFAKIKQVLLEAIGDPETEDELPPPTGGWCCRRRKIDISILENAQILEALRPLAVKIERLKKKILDAETLIPTFEGMIGKSVSLYDPSTEKPEFDEIDSVISGSAALKFLPYTGPVSHSDSTGASSTVKRKATGKLKAVMEAILKAINKKYVRYAFDDGFGPINQDWMNPVNRLKLYNEAIDAVKDEESITQEEINKALPYISDDLLKQQLREIGIFKN